MEEAHRLHKDVPFGWIKALRNFMEAQAHARHERALLLWGETRLPDPPPNSPDRTYMMIRSALGPRF
jgi:hypothetical protein